MPRNRKAIAARKKAARQQQQRMEDRRDRYNDSMCLDMTAYLALKNVEREEQRKQPRDKPIATAQAQGGKTHED
jgi:hypothetical protein